jgi:hypothetical protein
MARRPVFVANEDGHVLEKAVDFQWHPGMSASQKRKSVKSLHEAAAEIKIGPILEVSTKSESSLGQSLSALMLSVSIPELGEMPVECAFQGSKVFEAGGPYWELYGKDSMSARRDQRLHDSGALKQFNLNGVAWPLEPKTAFYDWLYLRGLIQNSDLSNRLEAYRGFTDIEFNPKRSFNTQARSCALFVALQKRQVNIESILETRQAFIDVLKNIYEDPLSRQERLIE